MGQLASVKNLCLFTLMILLGVNTRAMPTADSDEQVPLIEADAVSNSTADSLAASIVDSSQAKSLDTLYYIPSELTSKAILLTNPIDFEDHLKQKPTTALFKSMFVPGWGQLGNRSYFKAAIVIGIESWLVSNVVHYRNTTSDKFDQYQATADTLTTQRDALYFEYQNQRSLRNKYSWFAGLTIFISMFDAYVDAHMSGAPDKIKQRKIGFDMRPDRSGGFKASLSMSF